MSLSVLQWHFRLSMKTNEPSPRGPALAADSVLPSPDTTANPDAVTTRIRQRRARARVAARLSAAAELDDHALAGTPEHLAQIHARR
jgi:hypothetical protein